MKPTLFVSMLLSLVGCGGGDAEDTGMEGAEHAPTDFGACRAASGDEYRYAVPATGSEPASITGDLLTVSVAYSGGCEEHEFVLCWPEAAFSEGVPVGVGLEMWHDANGDACEAAFVETFFFDLDPLAKAYSEAYGSTSGEIGVTIAGMSLLYSF